MISLFSLLNWNLFLNNVLVKYVFSVPHMAYVQDYSTSSSSFRIQSQSQVRDALE